MMFRLAARVFTERMYRRLVTWWFFDRYRWRCRVKFHHVYIWTEIDDWHCERCHVDRDRLKLLLFWGVPGLWRVSFRVKHGRWA